MKKRTLLAAIMLLCVANSANAIQDESQEDSYTIYGEAKKNQITTLDNYIDDLSTSSISIDKYTREDIQRQNNPSLGDILQQSTGVVVNTNSGSDGNVTKIRIRGTDRVRIQIDGLRADRTTGIGYGAETQFMNTDDLESIEVIKGAQGNVLGTNALGGSINMTTRRGRGPFKFELGSEAGQLHTYKERAAIMGEYKSLDYYLSMTYYKTAGGMRTTNLGRLYNDEYKNLSLVSNLGYKLLDDKAEIRNIFRFSNAKKGLGDGYQNVFPWSNYNDPNNYARNLDIMENLSWKHTVNDFYDYSVRFGIYQNNNYNYDYVPDAFDPTQSAAKYRSNRINLMTQHNFNLADWNKLSIGYNMEREYANFLGVGDITQWHTKDHTMQHEVYINDSINIKDKLFIRGGVRYMHNSQYGDYVMPNGSAALILPTFKIKGAKTKFRGSWGQSVNNPSLYQRYVNSSYPGWWSNYIPNPGLKAEKLTSWDAGIEQSFWDEKIKFDFGYFHSNYKDYITNVYTGSDPITWFSNYQYQNIDKARIYGYEGSFTFEPNDIFKFVLNYTYTNTEDKTTGLDLPQAPNNTYSAMVYYTPFRDRWDIYAGLVTTSSRRVAGGTNPDNRVKGTLDGRLGTKVRLFSFKGLHFYLRADVMNLFNQNNCVYRSGTNYYYSPKIHSRIGIFIEYDTEKQQHLDEQKAIRAQIKEQKHLEARKKIEEQNKKFENL